MVFLPLFPLSIKIEVILPKLLSRFLNSTCCLKRCSWLFIEPSGLLANARQRKFDLVLCWKIDRLFRSLKHLILTLQEFDELGIKFISLKDQIDLTTSSGRLLMQIIGAMGEFEAALIKERVKTGLDNAKAKGIVLGRRKVFDREQVLDLRASGKTIRQIASELHISKSTVANALSNKPLQK
ncbi:MAG: hypothetical protein EBX50_19595 [Chitinophagia bacterium]|nr:hypothetical protein [Chitinophagia bacterium]